MKIETDGMFTVKRIQADAAQRSGSSTGEHGQRGMGCQEKSEEKIMLRDIFRIDYGLFFFIVLIGHRIK